MIRRAGRRAFIRLKRTPQRLLARSWSSKRVSGQLPEPVVAVWLLLRHWSYLKGMDVCSWEVSGAGSGLRRGLRTGPGGCSGQGTAPGGSQVAMDTSGRQTCLHQTQADAGEAAGIGRTRIRTRLSGKMKSTSRCNSCGDRGRCLKLK